MKNNAAQAPSLFQAYNHYFPIGAAITCRMIDDPAYAQLIRRHFNSITAENDMKPERVLSRQATLASGDPIHAAFDFTLTDKILSFARDAGIGVRFHTLLWHNQTPRWFFTENWSDAQDAPLASPQTLLARLDAYIRAAMEHVNGQFPGVVYTWDVVNEAIEPDHGAPDLFRTKSLWYQILGEEFVFAAFRAARKYQVPGQRLCYNDFCTFVPEKKEAIKALLKRLLRENLVDDLGMQAHLQLDGFNIAMVEAAVKDYASLGVGLQATEMDIHCPGSDDASQQALAKAYGEYFGMLVRLRKDGCQMDGATFWGVTDADSWLHFFRRGASFPLLFTGEKETKPAFYAVLNAAETNI